MTIAAEKCLGCGHIKNDNCLVYSSPGFMWRRGNCPMATHITRTVAGGQDDKKLNPLKASKRRVKQ